MNVEEIQSEAMNRIAAATDAAGLDEARVHFLGKKGVITALSKTLGRLEPDERPKAGAAINAAKTAVQEAIDERKVELSRQQLADSLADDTVDVTLPGRRRPAGWRVKSESSPMIGSLTASQTMAMAMAKPARADGRPTTT